MHNQKHAEHQKQLGRTCWKMGTNVWYSKVTNQDNIHTSTGVRFTIVSVSQDAGCTAYHYLGLHEHCPHLVL